MGSVIGDVLPLAVGIAVSPIPIIAAILMLLSPRARGTSVGFLFGWVLGIAVAVTVFTLLSAVLPQGDSDGSNPITAVLQLRPGASLSTGDVKAFVKNRIGSVKTPKQIEVWDDLPRSKIGKVLKTDIKAQLLAEANSPT